MRTVAAILAIALAAGGPADAKTAGQAATPVQAPANEEPFTFRQIMVPMRDGARLQTVIIAPRAAHGPLPILFSRTPYGVPDAAPRQVPARWATLARDGYIFVVQSMRGRGASDGRFTLSTALAPGKGVDEATDAYDTIDWLVRNLPDTNKRVGMWGVSYPGFAAGIALAKPHPALKAVSPQAAWVDYWQSDDLHRNGALRLTYATDWLYLLQHDKENADFSYDDYDTYSWFLKLGPVGNIDRDHFKGAIPMFTALVEHPDHDAFYTRQRWVDALGRTRVPTLNVAGYWDQEDPSGSWRIYERQELDDPDHLNAMVAGPWNHGYWASPGGTKLGPIDHGVDSTTAFLDEVQAPFFRYWLHNKGARPDYEVKSFQSGSWTWKSYAQWPPRQAVATSLYLQADGTLSFDAPTGEGCRSYVSDPASPVPFRPRPISPTYPYPDWSWWEAGDQRFVDGRPDVLTYTSEPLAQDLTVTGAIEARLMASTSGTDGDFIVKLIDVLPDDTEPAAAMEPGAYGRSLNGYELPVAMEVRRGRYLASDVHPQPLVPNRVVTWDVPLRDHDHVFRRGHRIMVQVQSSWFPVIDRNPQRFVPNIAKARPEDFVKASHQICSTAAGASRIVLPVMR